jgi:hypothetical protein
MTNIKNLIRDIIHEESSKGTIARREVANVGRPNSKDKLVKQAEIKTKIIDENAQRIHTIKAILKRNVKKKENNNSNPDVDFHPELKKPDNDSAI